MDKIKNQRPTVSFSEKILLLLIGCFIGVASYDFLIKRQQQLSNKDIVTRGQSPSVQHQDKSLKIISKLEPEFITVITVDSEKLKPYFNDYLKLIKIASVVPVSSPHPGKLIGFEITEISDNTLEQFGFQKFDIVTAINGRHLNSVSRVLEIFQLLRDQFKESNFKGEIQFKVYRQKL